MNLSAQWREQVSLIPGAYPMLHGWGPDVRDMESALIELTQENLDENGSDDEQLNCTYDDEEEDINNIIEEAEILEVSDAYKASNNGIALRRWEGEDMWEDMTDDEENLFESQTSRKRTRQM